MGPCPRHQKKLGCHLQMVLQSLYVSVNENVDVGMAVDYVAVGCLNVGICADVAVGMLVVN